ncbi:GNAT family N-acetyltransferase [Cardiobacteriaceae bacterium TAE3-ERU3]|nr:GNAT family N-acetyltransferase [Cardiobacteriaceae bacterium TAE3-ERU3]
MTITIRECRPNDIPAALELWASTPNMGMHPVDDTPEALTNFLAFNPGINFVAMDGDELVGIVLCGCDGRRGTIYHAAIAASHQRRGIATRMLNACENALKERGITRMRLMIFNDNHSGKAFWAAHGWQQHDYIDYYGKDLIE